MAKITEEKQVRAKQCKELAPDERKLKALEEIADALHAIRAYQADLSVWAAHIGRQFPVGRNN